MEENQVIARINGVSLDHEFFSHLSDETKSEIEKEIELKYSHIVTIEKVEQVMFAGVVTMHKNKVHVREVGGKFLWGMKWMEKYCTILAQHYGIKNITFCTDQFGVELIGKRMGFIPNGENEFLKAI